MTPCSKTDLAAVGFGEFAREGRDYKIIQRPTRDSTGIAEELYRG